jgi:hypothetical protein
MDQLAQLSRSDSDNFNELPSSLKDKIDFGEDFDLLSPDRLPSPSNKGKHFQNLSSDSNTSRFSEDPKSGQKSLERSPFNKIKCFTNLENIIEEESYELDSSKLTEKIGSFNEFDQLSFRRLKKSNENIFNGYQEDFSRSKNIGLTCEKALKAVNFILENPSVPHFGDSSMNIQGFSYIKNDEQIVNHVIDKNGFVLQTNLENRTFYSPETRANKDNQEILPKSAKKGKNLTENSNEIYSSFKKEAFQILSKEEANSSTTKFTNPNDSSEKADEIPQDQNSTINIYQNNNIVINITNDSSNRLTAINQTINNSSKKNIYFDLQKCPQNAFSKNKTKERSQQADAFSKPKRASKSGLTAEKSNLPSKITSNNKFTSSERSIKLSSSTGFDRSRFNSRISKPSNFNSEFTAGSISKSEVFIKYIKKLEASK